MTSKIANMVRQTSFTTGTGSLTLAANTNGYQTFNQAFGNGVTTNVFHYFVSNSNAVEWEYGTGHMSDATTMVRDTVVLSSNSNSAVSFTSAGGQLTIVNCLPQSILALLENTTGSGSIVLSSGAVLTSVQLGTVASGNLQNCTSYPTTTLITPVATTSGTTVVLSTSIPAGAKRVILLFSGVSTSGTSFPLVQIGPLAGVVNTGYTASSDNINSASSIITSTAGFPIKITAATNVFTGKMELNLESSGSNKWEMNGMLNFTNGGFINLLVGEVSLAGPLVNISITTTNGTDTFDAGEISVSYLL